MEGHGVNRYRISLSPEDAAHPQVTVSVELDGGAPRVTDVRFEGEVSLPAELADVDIRPVLRALATMLGGRPIADASPQQERQLPGPRSDTAPRGGARARRTPAPREPSNSAPSDLGATYWRLGTIGKLAKHYDVPHHVARAWIHDLQRKGAIPNPWAAKNSPPPPKGGSRRRG